MKGTFMRTLLIAVLLFLPAVALAQAAPRLAAPPPSLAQELQACQQQSGLLSKFAQGVVGQINDLQAQLQQANQIAALQAQLAAAKKPAPKTLPAKPATH